MVFSLPCTVQDLLVFIDWLLTVRKVGSSTVKSYLAGVRQLHIKKGIEPPAALKSSIIKQIIRGKTNAEGIVKRKLGPRRLGITKTVMLLLKEKIRQCELCKQEKRLIWAVAAIAFAGAFRIGEILCKKPGCFDPDFDLLGRDVQWGEGGKRLSFRLKCPKESKKAAAAVVDIFEVEGPLCPVRAFRQWEQAGKIDQNAPVFRSVNGEALSGSQFNGLLKVFLGPMLAGTGKVISAHSFRDGVVSMMAEEGYTEKELKSIGRWSSRAYETYVKKDRTTRARIARKL